MTMRLSLLAASAVLALATVSAYAAPAAKTLTPQQQRMASCAHQSKGMKGEQHKTFMSSCLKGKGTMTGAAAEEHKAATKAQHERQETAGTAAKHTQRDKMKTCSASAKGKSLKGAARKSFMKSCLKG